MHYPIHNIFYGNRAKYQINFGLPKEEISKNFVLQLEKGLVYSESCTFDMSTVQASLRVVNAPEFFLLEKILNSY